MAVESVSSAPKRAAVESKDVPESARRRREESARVDEAESSKKRVEEGKGKEVDVEA